MWVSKINERTDVLAKEGSISGTLLQDQARPTTLNTIDICTCAKTKLLTEWQKIWSSSDMGHYCYSIVPVVLIEACNAFTVDDRAFLVVMSTLASNHTDTRIHLQRINVVQDYFHMGYNTVFRKKNFECFEKNHHFDVQIVLFLMNHLT
jgi:hypothetical protein